MRCHRCSNEAADRPVVVLAAADTDADGEPAVAEAVDRRHLLRDLDRVVRRQDDDRRPQPHPLGERRRRRELHDHRVARVGDALGHRQARPRPLVDAAAPGEDLVAAVRQHGRQGHRHVHGRRGSHVAAGGDEPSRTSGRRPTGCTSRAAIRRPRHSHVSGRLAVRSLRVTPSRGGPSCHSWPRTTRRPRVPDRRPAPDPSTGPRPAQALPAPRPLRCGDPCRFRGGKARSHGRRSSNRCAPGSGRPTDRTRATSWSPPSPATSRPPGRPPRDGA